MKKKTWDTPSATLTYWNKLFTKAYSMQKKRKERNDGAELQILMLPPRTTPLRTTDSCLFVHIRDIYCGPPPCHQRNCYFRKIVCHPENLQQYTRILVLSFSKHTTVNTHLTKLTIQDYLLRIRSSACRQCDVFISCKLMNIWVQAIAITFAFAFHSLFVCLNNVSRWSYYCMMHFACKVE